MKIIKKIGCFLVLALAIILWGGIAILLLLGGVLSVVGAKLEEWLIGWQGDLGRFIMRWSEKK